MIDHMPIIEGQKVRLRPITISDTALIVKWRNNDSVRQNFIFQEPFTCEMHEAWMKNKVQTGEVVQYIIEDKTTNDPVGSVYLKDMSKKNKNAEYGIFIGEDSARGKGFGSETANLFSQFGLNTLGLHRIFLRVFAENKGAIKSYKKAGFVIEGIARDMVFMNDQYRDIVFMALLGDKE